MMQGLFPYGFPSVMAGPLFSNGSIRNEIRAGQFLPLWDRKADVAHGEILVRRSSWLDCPLSDPQADLGHGPSERPFMADSRRLAFKMSEGGSGSTAEE